MKFLYIQKSRLTHRHVNQGDANKKESKHYEK